MDLRIVNTCNNDCLFCLEQSYRLKEKFIKKEFIFSIIKNIKDKNLTFYGGNPLLHPDLKEIIKYSQDLGFTSIGILSNTYLINRKYLEELKENGLKSIGFYFNCFNEKNHNLINGNGISYNDLLKNLELLKNSGLYYKAIVHINNLNIDNIARDVFILKNKYFVENIDFVNYFPFDRPYNNRNLLNYDINIKRHEINILFKVIKKNNLKVKFLKFSRDFFGNFDEYYDFQTGILNQIGEEDEKRLDCSDTPFCYNEKRCESCFLKDYCEFYEQGDEPKYINEIIRINYKCNWNCKFCNVLKTNNYGKHDVGKNEVIYNILNLVKKYSKEELEHLILSFSGGEPTLNKNLLTFIKLAKKIGVGTVEIQTNGVKLFTEQKYIDNLINSGLDKIFLAQHSGDLKINQKMGCYYNIEDFIFWVNYVKNNNIDKKILIYLNIVITKINLFFIYEFIIFLKNIGFLNFIPIKDNNNFDNTRRISFGLVQPNGYADINRKEVLLKYDNKQLKEIDKIIFFCKNNNIYPDLHFTAPPICILNYPEYNLEYIKFKKIEKDKKNGNINKSNLKSYKILFKEKIKFNECNSCNYNNNCLGFYKNWINFVGEDYVKNKINKFLSKNEK